MSVLVSTTVLITVATILDHVVATTVPAMLDTPWLVMDTAVMVSAWSVLPMYDMLLCVCVDINECGSSNGGCASTCHNTAGSYYCSCPSGCTLNSNGHTCNGKLVHYLERELHTCRIPCTCSGHQ